jgi:hypothetical protein
MDPVKCGIFIREVKAH